MSGAHESWYVQLYAPDAGMPLQWRLLSGNNREAGRSATDYPDEQSCYAAIVELQQELDLLDGELRRMPSNLWAWQLSKGDTVLVTSGRDYDRMVRCRNAMETFLRGMTEAVIGRTVLLSSARRWESRGAAL
jgi:hypothetical protein